MPSSPATAVIPPITPFEEVKPEEELVDEIVDDELDEELESDEEIEDEVDALLDDDSDME